MYSRIHSCVGKALANDGVCLSGCRVVRVSLRSLVVVLIEGLWSNLSEMHQRDTSWCAESSQAHE